MKNILLSKDLNKDSIPLAGGKGANLGEMSRAGFPVPDFFVVSADAYSDFLGRDIGLKIKKLLEHLDVEKTVELETVSKSIRSLILRGSFSLSLKRDIVTAYENIGGFVAVRSSATTEDLKSASFAGMQATFLNVKGASEVVKHVQKCWASLFTSRAIYYRVQNNFDHLQAKIAVVVQKMVCSDASGVCFTINPVTNNKNEIVIESAFGLGESVVAGELTPDMFIVQKSNLEILKRDVNVQEWGYFRDKKTGKTVKKKVKNGSVQVLSDEQIVALASTAKKIEIHYGSPQDIEFVFEKGKLFVLQSRPVTTGL